MKFFLLLTAVALIAVVSILGDPEPDTVKRDAEADLSPQKRDAEADPSSYKDLLVQRAKTFEILF